ncbi:MAG: dTMP kinase [Geobacteraceae bacterium]|nr:dTMP kinase [Geobacteraceae bacterium]
MGFFITFEGVEGCGKTTQIRQLYDRLTKSGYRVMLTREPGGCLIADKIRSILLDAENKGMQSLTELLLYAAARAQHVAEVIMPALASGAVVLCDRFSDATIAYQHNGRGIERTTIDDLNTLACQSLRPDLTVLIDCDAALGLARAKSRIEAASGPREERFELEQLSFHQRVRDGYLQLAAAEPDRFLTVSAGGTIAEISGVIATQVLNRLTLKQATCLTGMFSAKTPEIVSDTQKDTARAVR